MLRYANWRWLATIRPKDKVKTLGDVERACNIERRMKFLQTDKNEPIKLFDGC
jgi:hypothetical protein